MCRALSLSKTTTKSRIANLENQGHKEIPEIFFSRNTHKFKIEITKNLKRSYRKMTTRTIEEVLSGSTKWTVFLNQTTC
jgi:hypothetical protein